jgi:hypothetical protein
LRSFRAFRKPFFSAPADNDDDDNLIGVSGRNECTPLARQRNMSTSEVANGFLIILFDLG